MHIKVDIPELAWNKNTFGRYWLGIVFMNNRPEGYQVGALVTEYMRLIEAAFKSYKSGRDLIAYVYVGRDPSEFPLGQLQAAITEYETCITCMHRAIRIFRRLRSRVDTPIQFKTDVLTKAQFNADVIAERIMRMRDIIHHLGEKFGGSEVPDNSWFSIMVDGPEVPLPPEPGQTLKTIDRLVIGKETILFSELSGWLTEMGQYAESIASYDFPKATP